MKSTLFVLILAITISVTGQNKETLLSAIENDNATLLSEALTSENINNCYKGGNSEYTLLALAIKNDKNNAFEALLKNENIDVDKECTGKTPLLYAAKYGKLEMMKKLFAAGANSKTKYKNRTLLDYAKKYEHENIIKYLTN